MLQEGNTSGAWIRQVQGTSELQLINPRDGNLWKFGAMLVEPGLPQLPGEKD